MSEASPLPRPSARQVREELERLVLGDLLGPKGGVRDEELTEAPRDWYLIGMLAPRRTGVAAEELDPLALAGDPARSTGRRARSGSPGDGDATVANAVPRGTRRVARAWSGGAIRRVGPRCCGSARASSGPSRWTPSSRR